MEQRYDRDVVSVCDASREEQLREIKKHLARPILAKEANGKLHMHSGALRRHARLEDVPEHPFARQLRELRERRGHE